MTPNELTLIQVAIAAFSAAVASFSAYLAWKRHQRDNSSKK